MLLTPTDLETILYTLYREAFSTDDDDYGDELDAICNKIELQLQASK